LPLSQNSSQSAPEAGCLRDTRPVDDVRINAPAAAEGTAIFAVCRDTAVTGGCASSLGTLIRPRSAPVRSIK
jgi:hypothetical protein